LRKKIKKRRDDETGKPKLNEMGALVFETWLLIRNISGAPEGGAIAFSKIICIIHIF